MIGLGLPPEARGRPGMAPPVTPTDPFPAAQLAAGGNYHHFAAEDAGETWASRHGGALTLLRRGTPTTISVGGLPMLDCTSGAYEVVRDSGLPAEAPFTLWVLCEPNTLSGRALYNGPPVYDTSAAALAFRPHVASALSGGSALSHTLRSSDPVRSYEWSRLGAGSLSAVIRCYENGQALSATNSSTALTDASGTVFVVGGYRNSGGTLSYAKLRVSDVVLTQGWVLDGTQRAALDSYRQARLGI